MKNLTERQKEILDLIKSYIGDFGFPPTRADISKNLGFKSANAAEQHLRAIEKKGYIKILSGASRGIVLNAQEEINNTSQIRNYKYRLENSITDNDSKIIILNVE